MQNDDTRDLMDTTMRHIRGTLSTVLEKKRQLAPAEEVPAGHGFPSALPSVADRKAALDKQYHERIKKVKLKYAGKMSPERMEELHLKTAGNIQPEAALAPSSGAVMNRVLTGSTLTPSPFSPSATGSQI